MQSKWPVVTLGELIEDKKAFLQTGPFGTALKAAEYSKTGVPLISVREIREGFFQVGDETPSVDQHTVERLPKFVLKKGDIVFGRKGGVERNALVTSAEEGWFLGSDGIFLRLADVEDAEFVSYVLRSAATKAWLLQNCEGTTMPSLNQKILSRLPVFYPPSSEKKKMAQVLRQFDRKITLNRQTNQTLENMAQALFKSWFVDFDPVIDNALAVGNDIPEPLQARAEQRKALRDSELPESIRQLFPDGFVFDAEMGWIPEGWEVQPVGKVIENVGGGTPRTKENAFWVDGTHPFCTPKDMSLLTSKTLLGTERHLTEAGLAKISSGQLPVGTVLMSSRAPIGYLAITDVPVSVNQGIIAMKPNDLFSSEYLLSWAEANMEEVVSRANGSTFLEISKKNFREIPFLMPEAAVLNRFDAIAKPYYQRIVSIQKNVNQLAKLRDTLLPKLISGELRIPEAQQQTEAAVA